MEEEEEEEEGEEGGGHIFTSNTLVKPDARSFPGSVCTNTGKTSRKHATARGISSLELDRIPSTSASHTVRGGRGTGSEGRQGAAAAKTAGEGPGGIHQG